LFFIALLFYGCPAKSEDIEKTQAMEKLEVRDNIVITEENKIQNKPIEQTKTMREYAKDKFLYKNENKTCPDGLDFEYNGSMYSLQFPKEDWMGSPGKFLLKPFMLKDGVEVLTEMAKEQLSYHYMKLMMDAKFKVDLQSGDKRYLYFPCRASFVLDLKTDRIIQFFRPLGESIGSLFYDEYNLAIFTNSITITDLNLGFSSTIVFHDERELLWAEISENNQIIYSTVDSPNKIKRLNHRVFSKQNSRAQSEYLAHSNMESVFSGGEYLSIERTVSRIINGVNYEIKLFGPDEPNNGRSVTAGEFLIDGNKFDGKGSSTYLKWGIAYTNFFSLDGKHIFIPYENGPVIYSTNDQSHFTLRAYGDDIYNYFGEDYILSTCDNTLHVTNTNTKISERISIYNNETFIINKDLKLVHRGIKEGSVSLYTIMDPLVLN